MKQIIAIISIIFMLSSCNEEITKRFESKPIALGKLNDVVILADEVMKNSFVKDTLEYYFESPYPVMPTPEPMFDLRYFTCEDLTAEPLKKELRTYIILADLTDEDSPTTAMLRKDFGEEKFNKALTDPNFTSSGGVDKWARGQLVIYLFGKGYDGVAASIAKNFSLAARRINKHDETQLRANVYAQKDKNGLVNDQIAQEFGVNINLPTDYKKAKAVDSDNFAWYKREGKNVEQHIVIRKFKYSSEKQFSVDSIIALRNAYGKKYIQSSQAESYMETDQVNQPIVQYNSNIDGAFTKELRGVWEMKNDFLAGPFFSYLIALPDKKTLVFIDVFGFGPGSEKREYMQQLEFIVKNIKLSTTKALEN